MDRVVQDNREISCVKDRSCLYIVDMYRILTLSGESSCLAVGVGE